MKPILKDWHNNQQDGQQAPAESGRRMGKKGKATPQIAALPVHWDKSDKLRVLMVTSRDTGRWVVPKGWLMEGKKPWQAAKIEALEEAGAVGQVSDEAIGEYYYKKRNGSGEGSDVLCRVTVFPMMVERLKETWKEQSDRKRRWFSLRKASKLVDEHDLSALLDKIAENPKELARL